MKSFILFWAITLVSVSASATNYYGEWAGKRYDFYLYGNNFYGSFGDERSDFYVAGENIYGAVAGARFDYYVRATNIYGTFPCGRSDYYIIGRNVYGTYCDQRFDIYFDSEEEGREYALNLATDDVVSRLPSPVQSIVRRMIRK